MKKLFLIAFLLFFSCDVTSPQEAEVKVDTVQVHNVVTQLDTMFFYDTVIQLDTMFLRDTTVQFALDTVNKTVVQKVHDTVLIPETLTVYDTVVLNTVHDTIHKTKIKFSTDTVYKVKFLTDTIYKTASTTIRDTLVRVDTVQKMIPYQTGCDNYIGTSSGLWIEEEYDGEILVLSNGSVWEIRSLDSYRAMLWLPLAKITISLSSNIFYPYTLTKSNYYKTESVDAHYVGEIR